MECVCKIPISIKEEYRMLDERLEMAKKEQERLLAEIELLRGILGPKRSLAEIIEFPIKKRFSPAA